MDIDFKNLKYNLYDILNIPSDSDEKKIKKQFIKVIKTFHPDKNSELEQEIYYHLILSNQILLDKELRKSYDNFLILKADSFNELKISFNKTNQNITQLFPDKDSSLKNFNKLSEELDNKHNLKNVKINDNIMNVYKVMKESRNGYEFKINNENIKNMDEFNNIFTDNKKEGKFKDVLVKYNGSPSELSTYVIGEQYTNIMDLDKLYIEDSVQTDKYSSLDRAFMLQPVFDQLNETNIEDKIKEYNDFTENQNSKSFNMIINKK